MSAADITARNTAPESRSDGTKSAETRVVVVKFLTPHKILLVILIHAYCMSSVPTRSHTALFKLLLDHIEVHCPLSVLIRVQKPKGRPQTVDDFRIPLSEIPSAQGRKTFYLALAEMVTHSITDMPTLDVEFGMLRPLSLLHDVHWFVSHFSPFLRRR
jgi:hypothetical protein